jgi:hypothetical protein
MTALLHRLAGDGDPPGSGWALAALAILFVAAVCAVAHLSDRRPPADPPQSWREWWDRLR